MFSTIYSLTLQCLNQECQSEGRKTKLRKFVDPKAIPALPIAHILLSFLLVANHYSADCRLYLCCVMVIYEDKIGSVLQISAGLSAKGLTGAEGIRDGFYSMKE